MYPLKPICDSIDEISLVRQFKKSLAYFQSFMQKDPVVMGKVLTPSDEVAGHPVPEYIEPYSGTRSIVLKKTIAVYPLGTKVPTEQYLLRDESNGAYVIIGRKEFQTLFTER